MLAMTQAGLRERKKVHTREALAQAALDLFARQGFDHTTIDEIADMCDISPRTFFRYFPSKEAVLYADADQRRDQLMQALAERPAGEAPLVSIRQVLLALVRGLENDRGRLLEKRRIFAETASLRSASLEHQQGWEDAILEAMRSRQTSSAGPSPFEIRLVTSLVLAALRVALSSWLEDGGDLMAIATSAFDRIAVGLDNAVPSRTRAGRS
jgi:AcrR family transcriptional regulator